MDIIMRCDADLETGLGHLMRSLALAQYAKEEGSKAVFVCCAVPENMKKRLETEGLVVKIIDSAKGSREDACATVKIASDEGAGWIVTDGYHFGLDYQEEIKQSGIKLLCIDDMAKGRYICDAVLNQNPGFDESRYDKDASTQLLSGLKYFLLRKEFRSFGQRPRRFAGIKKVLVTMGGTDPGDLSGKVIEALSATGLKKMTVLLSSLNPNLERIEGLLGSSEVQIDMVIDSRNIVPYLKDADLAIHAAGVTSWELAFMGVPGMFYTLADNQEANAKKLEEAGCSKSLGRAEAFSPEALLKALEDLSKDNQKLRQMSEAGKTLIDGMGPERAFSFISGGGDIVSVKRSTEDDIEDYFKWRNSPEVYRYFFNPSPVGHDDHVSWFRKRMGDKGSFLYTAYSSTGKIGSIRFEDSGAGYKVSVMVDPALQGKGFGTKMIKKGVEALLIVMPKQKDIIAEIKEENAASVKAFTKAGFEKAEKSERMYSIKMVYKR